MEMPWFSIQGLMRSGVDLISSSINTWGMKSHFTFNVLFNSSVDFGSLDAMASFIIDEMFSITDKSGEFTGHSGF
jgi:hypothetical protein